MPELKAEITEISINQILVNVNNIMQQIESLSNEVTEQSASLDEATNFMDHVNNLLIQDVEVASKINDSMIKQENSFKIISSTANELDIMADGLKNLIDKFKL